jgi:hypothetical protein
MHTTRTLTFSCLALLVLAAFSGQAFAGSVVVGNCPGSGPHFTTIQAAVNYPSSTIVKVCPGIYREQVVINKPLNLQGVVSTAPPPTQDAAVILPPLTGLIQNTTDVFTSAPVAAQLLVLNTVGPVLISNLTVDGKGNGLSCGPDVRGILFQNASGTVNHVAVRNQVPNDVRNGCQVGHAIWVESAISSFSTVLVENSSVHNYNKNGIVGRRAGTTLNVTGNYVQGSGLAPCPPPDGCTTAAQNGIEIVFGARGTIKGNNVIDNIYGDPIIATSSDILLYDAAEASGIAVTGNTLGNSNIPIGLVAATANFGDAVTVTGNKISGPSTIDGIDVCTNNNTVTGNTIFNSAESAVHLDATCAGGTGNGNVVTLNTILESDCAGILVDTLATGNNTSPDTFYTVPFPVASSTGLCPFVAGEARPANGKTTHKFSPGD